MAYEVPGFSVGTEVAAADLSTHQFKAVTFSATGWALAGADEQSVGFLQDKPASGAVAQVMISGVSKAVAGAAITKGALLKTDASGRVVAAGTGEHAIAEALAAAGAAGELLSVIVGYRGTAP